MTLLVVLGVVVVATILAALYLSLKSGRGDEPDPGDVGTGDWPARGGSRSGRSPSLAGRVRSMTDRGRAGGPSRRRSGRDDDEDFDVPDYVSARRASRGADSPDRSGLVTAGADQRVAGSRRAAGFDETDPSMQPGYSTAADYNGYDAAADTRVSDPLGAGSAGYGTESYSTDGYGAESYSAESYGAGGDDAALGRGGYRPGGERGRGGARSRGRSAGAAQDSSATDVYSSPDGYGPRRYPPADRPGTGEQGSGPGDRDFGAGEPDFSGGRRIGGPPGYDFGTDPGATAAGTPAASGPHGHARPGGRRRAISPGQASSAPGRSAAPSGRDDPEGYDDAPTPATDSSFSSPGTGSRAAEGDDRSGRRRIAKIQRPSLRVSRSRPDYDNDPWPSADEVDGISDDQYWSDLSSDKPLATMARAAQDAADTDQSWAPGDGSDEPGFASAPVQADSRTAGRDRRARRREAEDDGPEPRPLPPAGGGRRRRDEPAQSRRGAEEDPLTSASYSRHARQASDSQSYRGSREARRPSHGRPDAATDETQTMQADPRGYGAPAPRGARGAGPGGSPPRPARLGRVEPAGPTRAAGRAGEILTATGPGRPLLTAKARAATSPPRAGVPGMHPRRGAPARPRRTARAGYVRHFRRAARPPPVPLPAVAPIRARPAAALTTRVPPTAHTPEAPEVRIRARPAAGPPPARRAAGPPPRTEARPTRAAGPNPPIRPRTATRLIRAGPNPPTRPRTATRVIRAGPNPPTRPRTATRLIRAATTAAPPTPGRPGTPRTRAGPTPGRTAAPATRVATAAPATPGRTAALATPDPMGTVPTAGGAAAPAIRKPTVGRPTQTAPEARAGPEAPHGAGGPATGTPGGGMMAPMGTPTARRTTTATEPGR